MKKWQWIAAIALVTTIGIFAMKHYTMLLDSKDSAQLIHREFEAELDYSNQATLVSEATNIFVGEVVEEKGYGTHAGNPATFYDVGITQNIKGGLIDNITVVQDGGYYKEGGKLYYLQYEQDQPLQKGQMYMFYVIAEKPGEYWMMPTYGYKTLKNEKEKYEEMNQIKAVLEE